MTGILAVIAANTFREVLRDRVWFVLLGFGLVLLVSTRLLTPLALGEGPRITVDLGLSTLALLGVLVVAVVGASLVHQEIDRRTAHVILARPVSRTTYLLGKWAGLTASLWAAGGLMGIALVVVARLVRGPEVVLPLTQAVVLVCFSFAILTALAVLFSSLSSPLLSSLYTVALYAVGFWTSDLRDFAKAAGQPFESGIAIVSYTIPNLDVFSARLEVAHAEPVAVVQVVLAAAYAAAYVTAVLAIASIAFQNREFK